MRVRERRFRVAERDLLAASSPMAARVAEADSARVPESDPRDDDGPRVPGDRARVDGEGDRSGRERVRRDFRVPDRIPEHRVVPAGIAVTSTPPIPTKLLDKARMLSISLVRCSVAEVAALRAFSSLEIL